MNSSVSRKRAGGSAISGSTKRQRGGAAAWRDELAEDEGDDGAGADKEAAAPAAPSDIRVALGLSEEEEEIMDPGTPLPSEDEKEEAEAPAGGDVVPPAAEASGSSDAPAATAAAADAAESSEPAVAESEAPQAAASSAAPQPTDAGVAGGEPVNGCAARATTIWLEIVSGEDGDDERASEPMEVMLREGLRPAVLERLAACMPPGRGAVVDALVPGLVCTFAKHAPLKLPRQAAAAEAGAEEPAEAATGAAGSADAAEDGRHAAGTNGKVAVALPEASCHSAAGLLTAPRDAPGLALTLGPARLLDATHDVLGPVLLGRRVVQRLGALAPLMGGPAPAKPLSLRAVPSAPVEAPPAGEAVADAPPAVPVILKTAPAEVPVDSRPFLLEETQVATPAEELDVLGLELDTRDAEVQELKQQVFSRERQESVAAIDEHLAGVERRLLRLEAEGMAGEAREQLSMQGMWLKERIRHLVRLIGKLK